MTGSSLLAGGLLLCGSLAAFPPRSGRRLAGLTAAEPRKSLLHKGILGLVAAVALVAVIGPLAAALAGAAGAVVTWVVIRARARQAEESTRAAVVELLRAVAGELRAGRPAGVAFAAAARSAAPRLGAAIGPLSDAAARGDPGELAAALRAAAESGGGLAGLARFAACWQVAATSGAALAPAVDRVADALHDEIEFAAALTAALAGPRATARLLAVLPILGLALGGVIGARPLAFLVGSPAGLCCLAVAAGFEAAGVGWARRIARRAALPG